MKDIKKFCPACHSKLIDERPIVFTRIDIQGSYAIGKNCFHKLEGNKCFSCGYNFTVNV